MKIFGIKLGEYMVHINNKQDLNWRHEVIYTYAASKSIKLLTQFKNKKQKQKKQTNKQTNKQTKQQKETKQKTKINKNKTK